HHDLPHSASAVKTKKPSYLAGLFRFNAWRRGASSPLVNEQPKARRRAEACDRTPKSKKPAEAGFLS
ncbi:hypothetical protein, partial [Pseudoalteromonas sp. T1lg10]|uniref:hypothetical protein n=1 Tax=Pseudoalteromonas sp. T1lg10 TaxID=2077093 RepID=UPI001F1FF222